MQITFWATVRYFMHAHKTDMRKGVDGLRGIIQNDFCKDPLLGDVFIFLNQSRNTVKILHWQGDGFAMYYKKLQKGTFEVPHATGNHNCIVISSQQLQFILEGVVLNSIKKRVRYEHQIVSNVG